VIGCQLGVAACSDIAAGDVVLCGKNCIVSNNDCCTADIVLSNKKCVRSGFDRLTVDIRSI